MEKRFPMNTLLQHRGFQGSIEVSPEDNCLFGKLQFIPALVSYEGQTAAGLSQAFRDAVDDYLATGAPCELSSSRRQMNARSQNASTACASLGL